MSALSALKGYRTQFLYSLHYILSNQDKPYIYRLEGEEDLDVLDEQGYIVFAIQVKNLSKVLGLSDLVSQNKTSFLKRFVSIYPKSTPVLVSFGPVNQELKNWKNNPAHKDSKERSLFQKAGISEQQTASIKEKLGFVEISEEVITREILEMLKMHKSIDPEPTAENLLYFIQYAAEKQQLISTRDLLGKIDEIGLYLSERMAFASQYGIFIKPLIKAALSDSETEKLKSEFYYGISARFEHVYLDLDVPRDTFLHSIDEGFNKHNVIVISGASGQGKSTLAYRFVFNKASQSLIYEISLQEDPAKINEAIVAIAALTKGLKVPIYFILHVAPNTTSWLRISREFANNPFLRLLVTIRNEDWFRAQASEIEFLYTEVELELSEKEAEVIFDRLEKRGLIKTHNDFKDAWMEFGSGVPLLEFIHAITQGSSLREKLKSQLVQINKEEAANPIGQLALLRMLSLADAYGARIDLSRVAEVANIKLIIDKFDREYLLKHSSDGKYLSGLHPIRSTLLVELLFDEFLVCKKDYIESCLNTIEQDDTYTFILQALYQNVVNADEMIAALKSCDRNSWMIYNAATKAVLWVGIRDYIAINQQVLDDVYKKTGDAWMIITDIYHGNVLDLEEVLTSLPGNNQMLIDEFRGISQRLTAKEDVYRSVVKLFDALSLPERPGSALQWAAFGEALFWIGTLSTCKGKITNINEADFKEAFEQLDLASLSTLMLGMNAYSESFDLMRIKLSQIFNDRLRRAYNIPLIEIDSEIAVDFVVDMISDDPTKGFHEHTIEILDLLRTAYPDKEKYCSQGHGHRLDMMPLIHDETTKHISAKSLPLPQWVNINANLRRLVDYSHRPEDWPDYHQKLFAWEQQIKSLVQSFRLAFASFRKTGLFTELLPVMGQINYRSQSGLAAPKTSVDPLGIPVSIRSVVGNGGEEENKNKESFLSEKYKPFFDSYHAYRISLENFIRQSGQACQDVIKKRGDSGHVLEENNLRVSHINLYDAAAHRPQFESQREKYFKRFSSNNAGLSDAELFGLASTWKSFWAAIDADDPKRIVLTEGIVSLKNDFVNSLTTSIKATNKKGGFKVVYRNDVDTGFLPVFISQIGDPRDTILAIGQCYQIIFDSISGTEYTSLKYMMLQRYFAKIYIMSEIRGYLFDLKWHEFPLHLFLDTPFESLPVYRFGSCDIQPQVISALKLKSWLSIHPGVKMVQELAIDFEKLKLYIGHVADLSFFDDNKNLDELGDNMIKQYVLHTGKKATEIWNNLLERLTALAEEFNEEIVESGSLEDQQYWVYMSEVMHGLIPNTSNGGRITFDMASLRDWSNKLIALSESWGMFILLLQRRVLLKYEDVNYQGQVL
jgi:hypothetical protein